MNHSKLLLVRSAAAALVLVGVIGIALLAQGQSLSAHDRGRSCGVRTIEGDWGVSVSGTRVAGPGTTESFIGVALREYDGQGGFAEVASSHGQVSGETSPQIVGTYTVNPDCTGTAEFVPPGAPVVVRTAFVIVDKGSEIREIVLTPQPNMVTAVQRRIR